MIYIPVNVAVSEDCFAQVQMSDDLVPVNVTSGIAMNGSGRPILQDKTITPSNIIQTVNPDPGYAGLSTVTVNPIPPNYGLITWNGSVLTVS